MKALLSIIALCLALSITTAQAGLFGKLLKGGALVGAGTMIGRSVSADTPEGKRLNKMNSYVWKALKAHELDKPSLKQYVKELENSQDLDMADTASYAYAVLGQRAKAIKVYEDKILPYLPLEKQNTQNKFNRSYKIIKKCSPKACMGMQDGTLSHTTQKPPTEYEKLQKTNKYIWSELKRGEPFKTSVLDKLAYSGNISMADTGAYGYAVRRSRKKALKIYEQEILPKLADVSEAKRKKYQDAYEFLKTCNLQRCVHDRVKKN